VSPRCWVDASLSPSRRNVTERTFLHVVQDCGERIAAETPLLFGKPVELQAFLSPAFLPSQPPGGQFLRVNLGLNRPRSLP
jgi:hypothetical protein